MPLPTTMKTAILVLLSFASLSFGADTPAQIAADYREKAAAALKRVNETLENATVPLIAALVKKGDTAGAEALKTQMHQKMTGEPIGTPEPSAASLFSLYDAARAKAVDPAQRSALARIDGVLASSEGKKLDIVASLGKVRAEIEAGKVALGTTGIPVEWTYHRSQTTPAEADVWLHPDGKFVMQEGKEKKLGKWKPGKEPNTLTINYSLNNSVWKVTIEDGLATVERPDIKDTRYFRVKEQASAATK